MEFGVVPSTLKLIGGFAKVEIRPNARKPEGMPSPFKALTAKSKTVAGGSMPLICPAKLAVVTVLRATPAKLATSSYRVPRGLPPAAQTTPTPPVLTETRAGDTKAGVAARV